MAKLILVIMILSDLSCRREAITIIGPDKTIRFPTDPLVHWQYTLRHGNPELSVNDGKGPLRAKAFADNQSFAG
jgi:hypothetical protein